MKNTAVKNGQKYAARPAQVEEALKESEQRYISAEKIGQFGHWHRDFTDNEATWSAGAYKIFGVEPDQFKPNQENIYQLIHPDDKEAVRRARDNASLRGEKFDIEYRITRPDGEERVVHSVADVYRDEKGNPNRLFGTVIDTTERKRAEEGLRQSDEKYRGLFELAPIGITTLDMKGIVTSCNPAVYGEGGYTEDDLVGKHFSKIAPIRVRDIPKYIKTFNSIVRGKAPAPFEVAYARKDGTTGWTEVHISLLREGRKKLGVLVLQRDITESKRAEEEIRKFKLIADSAAYGVAIGSVDGILTYVNQSFAQMHGYSPDELVGRHFSILYTEEQMPIIQQLRDQLMQTGSFAGEEMWHRRKDGTVFPTIMTGNLMRDEKGNPSYLVGTTIDVTERKRAEKELLESEERYRALVNLGAETGEAVVMLQDDERGVGMHVFASETWSRITGYSTEELLNISMADLIHPRDREEAVERHNRRMQSEELPGLYEITILKKDGTEVPVEVTYAFSRYHGKLVNVGYIRDITERKKAEEEIQSTRDYLENLNNSLPEVIINVKHPERTIEYVNRTVETVFGYTPEECIGENIEFLFSDREEYLRAGKEFQNAHESGEPFIRRECLYRRKNGEVFLTEVTVALVSEKGKITGRVGVISDITERKRAEEALRTSEENFRNSLDASPLGVRIVSADGELLYANKAILDIYGYSSIEELKATPVKERYTPESYSKRRQRIEKRKQGEYVAPDYEISIIRQDGEIRHLAVFRKEVIWNGEPQFQTLYQDITERKRAEELLLESNKRFTDIARVPRRLLKYSIALLASEANSASKTRVTRSTISPELNTITTPTWIFEPPSRGTAEMVPSAAATVPIDNSSFACSIDSREGRNILSES